MGGPGYEGLTIFLECVSFFPENSSGMILIGGYDLNTFGSEATIAAAVTEREELGDQLAEEGCGREEARMIALENI